MKVLMKKLLFLQKLFSMSEWNSDDNEIMKWNHGGRDPPWINSKIKSLIKNKTEYFKNCVKPNNPDSIKHFEQI